MSEPEALRRWRSELAAWRIPEPILAAVDRSPWETPREPLVRRARRQVAAPEGESFPVAAEALRPSGEVLDVGAGAGAASLPLASWASVITAVDTEARVLETLAADSPVPTRLVPGQWPDVAAQVEPADVVVCYHVLYNVAELAPFVRALTTRARRRVVVELTAEHPLAVLNPLWLRFHNLARPAGPTAADAVAALRALGLDPTVLGWQRPARNEYPSRRDLVAATGRRLCLPPDRFDEVDEALHELGGGPYLGAPVRDLVTIWWPGSA